MRDAINLPLSGTAKLDLSILSPSGKLAEANGEITLSCDNVVIGDGKTPLKVAGNPFLSGGLTLPKVRLDDFGGHVAIDKGLAKLQEIAGKSRDGEVALEGEVTLRDPLPTSTVNAYLRFKLSDAFLKQASAVPTMLQMVGAQGKRPDGFYGMRLSGRLGQLNPPVLSPTSPIVGAAAPADARGDHAGLPAARSGAVRAAARGAAGGDGRGGSPPPPPEPAAPPPPPPPPPPAATRAARAAGRRLGHARGGRLASPGTGGRRWLALRRPPRRRRAARPPAVPPPACPTASAAAREPPAPLQAVAADLVAERGAGDRQRPRGAPPAAGVSAKRPGEDLALDLVEGPPADPDHVVGRDRSARRAAPTLRRPGETAPAREAPGGRR